ncbi:hypothetical protein MLD38_027477 [Melastoma candidum]|uniref:Uncharacterized protein n=1 Tax=Melastoma candidum TaxID=119954 RepID=A0ACB9P1N7_9MYRT|nr:hypothetical protein MLD38_027477 [Melastoma candidum]
MAKGRKLTFSLSERYHGSYNNNYDGGANGTAGSDASELGEEDVWSTIDDEGEDARGNCRGSGDDAYRGWSPTEGSSMVRRRRNVGGLSLAFEDLCVAAAPRIVNQLGGRDEGAASSPRGGKKACSAPVNVPDWSKIYRVDSVESMHGSDEEEGEGQEMVPPHEYLAKSRKIAAESVFEGVGRTLKGREMRRVRDAVWSRTGFDG